MLPMVEFHEQVPFVLLDVVAVDIALADPPETAPAASARARIRGRKSSIVPEEARLLRLASETADASMS